LAKSRRINNNSLEYWRLFCRVVLWFWSKSNNWCKKLYKWLVFWYVFS